MFWNRIRMKIVNTIFTCYIFRFCCRVKSFYFSNKLLIIKFFFCIINNIKTLVPVFIIFIKIYIILITLNFISRYGIITFFIINCINALTYLFSIFIFKTLCTYVMLIDNIFYKSFINI